MKKMDLELLGKCLVKYASSDTTIESQNLNTNLKKVVNILNINACVAFLFSVFR